MQHAIIDDGGRRTGMRPYQMEIPCEELKTLLDWIDSEKLECAEDIAQATNSAYYSSPPQCKNFYIADYWGMWYNKNAPMHGIIITIHMQCLLHIMLIVQKEVPL